MRVVIAWFEIAGLSITEWASKNMLGAGMQARLLLREISMREIRGNTIT